MNAQRPARLTRPRKSELVSARVDYDTKRRLRLRAEDELLDESDIVRLAIREYLQTPRTHR